VGGGTKWNLLDSKTGTTAILTPSNFDELCVMVKVNQNDNLVHQFNIPKAYIPVDNSSIQLRNGWYSNSTAYGTASIGINKAGLWIAFATYLGTEYKDNSTITVYYR